MKEQSIGIGESYTFKSGIQVSAVIKDPLPYKTPSDTARHETHHTMVNVNNVKEVSIIAQGDSLGHTTMKQFDAKAAAAAHAFGMDGTSWDTFIIEAQGQSVSAADAGARAALAGKGEHIEVLAGYLEARKSISGEEAKKVVDRVDNGETVIVEFKTPNGEKTQIEKHKVKEKVIFLFGDPEEIGEDRLPQAA